MLRRLPAILALTALIVLPISAFAQEASTAVPKLSVPEKIVDLGQVAQGVVMDADFTLLNEGQGLLEVRAVRPTCGCTVADFDREVAPGGQGLIKAKLDTAGFSGPISKSILVMTNDQETPTLTLVIKANVQPFIEVMPRPLVRFNAIQSEPATQTVTLVSETVESFNITGVSSSVPFVTASHRKLEGDERIPTRKGAQYQITMVLAENAPAGPVNAEVTVLTDHPKAPKVTVKAFGVVRAMLYVTPTQLQFGSIEAKVKPARNVVVVNNRPDRAVKVTGVKVNDPAFSAELFPIQDGKRYQVTVTVNETASAGNRDAVLTISTDDPQYPEITVPVRASLR